MDKTRVSCRRTSTAALPSSPDTGHWGKPVHRIAAVEVFLNDILDDGTEIPVLLLETILILSQKRLEIMKKHPVLDTPGMLS